LFKNNFVTRNSILYRVAFVVDETFSAISGETISSNPKNASSNLMKKAFLGWLKLIPIAVYCCN